MDADNLSGPVEKAIKSLEKAIHDIESKVGERMLSANNLRERHLWYAEAYPALWKMETQKISEILNCLELYDVLMAGGNEQCVQRPVNTKPSTSVLLVTTQSSAYSPPAPAEPFLVHDTGERALRCLISGAIPQGEQTSLIETVLSSGKATDMVGHLRENDAQSFVDVISEALENLDLAPQIRRECLRLLYKTCAGHVLLPRSLQVELPDSITGVALYRGGFGDVWNCEYQGRQVAVKVLRTYVHSDLRKIIRRFCKEFVTWKALCHPNVLPLLGVAMLETQFAMVSEWMPNGNINHFVKSHLDVNRFELLGDVARGLIHMHEQGMVHGDLKGTNILIDETGHARLADFGLLTIISDTTKLLSSTPSTQGGTYRWMSPELSFPEEFGLRKSRPTKSSDCWALGMVVYEVLSGRVPFYHYKGRDVALALRVLKGERPERRRGAGRMWFTDDIWRISERCWAPERDDRPRIEDVLQVLEKVSSSWTKSPLRMADSSSVDLPVQCSFHSNSEGSTEESDTSSPSYVAPSQPLRTLSQKGDANNEKPHCPFF
ncbi:kinase-like protein [Thelephora ganbajun]|uniref:Kinase-like protein n=1 Tax=Thelephora ganbajun TaxID=370292 RepID=A0ACB6Z7C0_THEGA|nr:kinase-like protein [Thelephora ganbajun]